MIDRFLTLILATAAICGVAYGDSAVAEQPARVQIGQEKKVSKKCHKKGHHYQNHRKGTVHLQPKCCSNRWYVPPYQPTYYIKSIGAGGSTIVMYDETVFAIDDSSAYIAARWVENSPIIITTSGWGSKYEYCIKNEITKESVTAKLSQGPFEKYAVYISYIDWNNGQVYLKDGSRWEVTPNTNFLYWTKDQAVLMGKNTGWWGRDYILININENNYLTATRLPSFR